MTDDLEILRMASSVGLSSTYDATRSSYADWRNKVLAFAQLLKEKDMEDDNKLVEQAIPEAEIYKREWVDLTDEEIAKLADYFLAYQIEDYRVSGVFTFARAIEAKLKEKNT